MPRSSLNKDLKFSADVTLLKSGKIKPGAICSASKVISLSNSKPTKKESINTVAKVFSDHIAFKNKLPSGSRKKKILRYEFIVLTDQSADDRRKLFIQCEKPGNAYFFLLGFAESSNINDLIQHVTSANSKVIVRGEVLMDLDVTSTKELHDSKSEKADINDNINGYIQPNYSDYTPTTDSESMNESPLESFLLNGVPACETYISAWDDEIIESNSISGKVDSRFTKLIQQDNTANRNLNNARHPNNKNCITTYTYVGPEGYEDSINGDHVYVKHRSMDACKHRINDRAIQNAQINGVKTNFTNPPIKHYSDGEPCSVRSRRPKSRQLPLSEEEKARSGWHSGFMFVTPKPGGGSAITEDGPVVLFSASRANVGNTSDEDTDDSDEDLSCSSSTLSDEDGEITLDRTSYVTHGLPRRN